MKKFIIQILFFCLIFFFIDKAFILVKNHSPELEIDKRLEKIITGKIDSEIIVLGSSRGARNILANKITTNTNSSCMNLSYPGSNLDFHEFLLKQIIKFSKLPKTIILTIDPSETKYNEALSFRFDRLYPLVKYQPILDELINRKEKNSIISKLLVLHQLNKDNFNLIPRRYSKLDTITVCGSMPISFRKKNENWDYENLSNYSIENENPKLITSLNTIQNLCEEHKIQLILAFPPNFNALDSSFIDRIKNLTDNNLNYFVYNTSNEEYRNKENFYDKGHLNKAGASIYTDDLSEYLSHIIQ